MASSIRILSSTDVDKILPQLDILHLIDFHTATLFRTLTLAHANTPRPNPDGDGSSATHQNQITDPGSFVHSPHRLAVRAGISSTPSPTNNDRNDEAPGPGGDGSGSGSGSEGGGRSKGQDKGKGKGKGGGGIYTTLVMPSSVANYGTTVKLVSVPNPTPTPTPPAPVPAPVPVPAQTLARPTHTSRGLPATTIVVDERTGAVKAVVNARALSIRTAFGEWSFGFGFGFGFWGCFFFLFWERWWFI
jgi:hypothetical protein